MAGSAGAASSDDAIPGRHQLPLPPLLPLPLPPLPAPPGCHIGWTVWCASVETAPVDETEAPRATDRRPGGLDRQMHTAVTTVAGAPRQTTARAGARWKGRPDAHSSADGHWRRRRATRARPAPAVAGVSCRMPDARCQKSRTARGDDGADGGLLAPRAVRTLCAGARLLEKKLGVGGARARCALAPRARARASRPGAIEGLPESLHHHTQPFARISASANRDRRRPAIQRHLCRRRRRLPRHCMSLVPALLPVPGLMAR